jgi:pimeloyl-ACP methyl ester carboxylesterase
MRLTRLALITVGLMAQDAPAPPGRLVDIGGGQRMHLNCVGSGSPTVVFEGGAGDFSVIWALVQERVRGTTRACSYDRAGYAWSDPGHRPRTFAQLALELQTLLATAGERAPYVLVGQSFGGSLVRNFAERYPSDVAGMVLVDAIHEDGYVFYGGQPHRIREGATGRVEPAPRIAVDSETIARSRTDTTSTREKLEPPLDRMPAFAQRVWQWAAAQPIYRAVQPLEMEWSGEVAERMVRARQREPASLGDTPLIVLARTRGDYAGGMRIGAVCLERLRRAQQADLARLSRRGTLRFAPNAGHNIHLEDPAFVARAILDVVARVRGR